MSSTPSPKLKHKKSVVVAFHRLIKAASEGSDVLILDIRDKHANSAVQEYNDLVSDEEFDTSYARFLDRLAESFSYMEMCGRTSSNKMPNRVQLEEADRVLAFLMRKRKNDQ